MALVAYLLRATLESLGPHLPRHYFRGSWGPRRCGPNDSPPIKGIHAGSNERYRSLIRAC